VHSSLVRADGHGAGRCGRGAAPLKSLRVGSTQCVSAHSALTQLSRVSRPPRAGTLQPRALNVRARGPPGGLPVVGRIIQQHTAVFVPRPPRPPRGLLMDAKVVLRELAAAVMAGDRRAWASVLLSVVVGASPLSRRSLARAPAPAALPARSAQRRRLVGARVSGCEQWRWAFTAPSLTHLRSLPAGALVNPPAAARAVRKASLYVLGAFPAPGRALGTLTGLCAEFIWCASGALHLLFGRDKKFKKPRPNPDLLLACPVRRNAYSSSA